MHFRLFIFDFDGTLADSGPWMTEHFNAVAKKFGFRQLSRDEIEAMRGRDSRAVLRELGIPWWRLPQIATHMRAMAEAGPTPPLFPGIAPMLASLHAAGATLALVSSNSEATIRRALGPETAALFHHYACAASMFGKAAKFKRVLKLAKAAPAQTIAIGDETRDIEAARAARLSAGSVAWGYATPDALRAKAPDFLFETPDTIAELARAQL